jgi:hypothetical protein
LVLCHFEETLAYLTQYPTSTVLLLRELTEDLDAIGALVEAELEEGLPKDLKKSHKVLDVNNLGSL